MSAARGHRQTRRLFIWLAALAILLAAPQNGHAAKAFLGKGGNMLLRADEVDYDINNNISVASGNVEIDYNQRILTADRVTYDQNKDVVTASGHVTIMAPNGDVVFADSVRLTDQMKDGVMRAFYGLMGQTGRMGAASAQRLNGNTTIANRGIYTHCKICRQTQRTPIWQVKAVRVIYHEQQHRIVFHDATFELFGVPVFYTPYLSMPDPTVKHKSGILAPDSGSSSVLGTFVELPLYVAFSDSEDATLAPMFTTDSGELLKGEYRQRWLDGGMWLQASIADNPHGGLAGDQNQWYSDLFGEGRIPLGGGLKLGYDAQLTSNDTYLKRYNISNLDRLTNDIYFEDEWGRSRLWIGGYYFQGLRTTDNNKFIPLVLPILDFSYVPLQTWFGGQFRFDLSGRSITRQTGPDSQRMSAETTWRWPFVTADGQLITLQLDARGDIYRVNNNDIADFADIPEKIRYIERGLPYAAIDWRWPFISGSSAHNSLVLEPIAQVVLAPYGGNPAGIPNEDSADFEFSDSNLLSFDRFPGYDFWESGPRANIGLHGVAYFDGGSIDALVGQVHRLKPDPIFSAVSGLRGKASDIVSLVTVKFPPYLELAQRMDINDNTGNVERNEVYLQASYDRSAVEVSYVRLPPQTDQGLPAVPAGLDQPREEVTAQAVVGVLDHWDLFAAGQRDLHASKMIESDYGFGYDDECLDISVTYRRTFNADRDIPPNTSILVHVNLKTDDEPTDLNDLFPHQIFTTP